MLLLMVMMMMHACIIPAACNSIPNAHAVASSGKNGLHAAFPNVEADISLCCYTHTLILSLAHSHVLWHIPSAHSHVLRHIPSRLLAMSVGKDSVHMLVVMSFERWHCHR